MIADRLRGATVAAVALFVLSVALGVGSVALLAFVPGAGDVTGVDDELGFTIGQGLLAIAYPAVGALVARRHPRNACGWILIAIGLFQGLSSFSYNAATVTGNAEGTAGAGVAVWVSNWIWFPSLALLTTFLLLLFPDGRVPSPGWRPFARLVGAGLLAGTVMTAAMALVAVDDPAALPPVALVVGLLGILLVGGVGSVASVVQRFRRSTGVERQQLKWLAMGAVCAFVGVLLTFGPELATLVPALVLLLAFPATIGLAILRFRLFDIDRLISRTVAYVLLTGVLAAVYAGGVVLLQPIVTRLAGDSALAVAMSTIAVAALFGPARRRIQSAVDRRFNRARYDAARTVDAFATSLRNQVDLDQLGDELLEVVGSTVAPARASLWLRPGAAP